MKPPQNMVPTVSTSQTRRSASAFQPKYSAMPPQIPANHLLSLERVSLSFVMIIFVLGLHMLRSHACGRPRLRETACLSEGKGRLNITTLQYQVLLKPEEITLFNLY